MAAVTLHKHVLNHFREKEVTSASDYISVINLCPTSKDVVSGP